MFFGESLPLDRLHPPRYWPLSVAKEHSAITTEFLALAQCITKVDKYASHLQQRKRVINFSDPREHLIFRFLQKKKMEQGRLALFVD
jgi:hypothetical protein